jgi:hypothetical protein
MTEQPSPVPSGRWLGIVGLVIATLLAGVSSIWEAFLTPLVVHWTSGGQAHFVRLPVSLVAALLLNAALAWFAYSMTGKMLAIAAPFLAWTAPMLIAAGRTHEGDLVLTTNNWVGISTMFVGALTYGVAVYWLTIRSLRLPRDGVVTDQVWRGTVEPR